MGRRWRCVLLGILLLGGGAARAQSPSFLSDPAREAIDCLTPAPQALGVEYPPELLKSKVDGKVRVTLTFRTPDSEPSVDLSLSQAPDQMVKAVWRKVLTYRMPCMSQSSAPVTLNQEFVFTYDNRKVAWNQPWSTEPSKPANGNCVVLPSSRPTPVYPNSFDDGNVIATLRFDRKNEPPIVRVLFDDKREELSKSVKRWAYDIRYGCDIDEPVHMLRMFTFRFEGDRPPGLNDVSLKELLTVVKDLDGERVRFDFGAMGCPFSLKLIPLQPYRANMVGEVGESNPNRKPFIEWLSSLVLEVPPKIRRFVIGSEGEVRVPCGSLDLT
jgi:hypothetical protein